jgi:pimeloyl-ACP methyl ester carboxylesterase
MADESIADWLEGQRIDLRGRKKVLRAAGVLSQTGDAARHLGGFSRYLQRSRGFASGDFLELTLRGAGTDADWRPAAYRPGDSEAPLSESTALVVRQLRWYDARLPVDQQLHLIGYSLGGVLMLRAAAGLIEQDASTWGQRLRSLITLASPHFGCDLGPEGDLLGLFGFGSLLPGGEVVRELCALGSDSRHRPQVERQARLLRRAGVQLLTLADENDVVVTPDDAIIAPPFERARCAFSSSRSRQGGVYGDAIFGHGPLLDNPKAWALMAETIGHQEPSLRTASGAIPL